MASLLSKLARAAFATRASPSAVGGIAGAGRPAAAIHFYSAGGPMSSEEEEEKARRNSEISWASDPSLVEARLADPSCISPEGGPPDERLYVDEKVLQSDEAMWAFYEQWCKIHGISRTRREMERRFKGFSEGAKIVHRSSDVGERKWMNGFADMTKKEGSRLIGRLRPRRK
ncbi:hypothetical protein QYE76_040510 [Lolium multiflorum]|uniref:Cathepsin propeptide inhibitor domain-containing protein n=1 Tax=Lolium multiflorum TaxID=4521 RepID=A0AAD8TD23_LOLMU|nr:hypothetical protein QYE76_040510 [Lolium multiflorum]